MARWLSWLERRPVTAEVDGSNPFRVARLKHISEWDVLFLLLLQSECCFYNEYMFK